MTETLEALTDFEASRLLREALAYLTRSEFLPAEERIAQVLESRPEDADALHLFGQMRKVQNRYDDAEKYYRLALAVAPKRVEAHLHLAQLLQLLGRIDEAMESVGEAIRLKPNFAEAHVELGMLNSAQGKFADAEKCYREALRLQPNMLAAKQALSATLISLGRHKEAEVAARAALAQAPRDPRWQASLMHNLAISMSEQRRYGEALKVFDMVNQLAPGLPLADFNRGNTLQSMGRLEDAEASYKRALARNPRDLKAHYGLNHLLYRMGREDFLRSYDSAVALFPGDPALFTEKARFLFLADRYQEASDTFAHALSLAPGNVVAREGFAAALSRLGEYGPALNEYYALLDAYPDNVEIRCSFAECLMRSGDPRKGAREAEEAMNRAPDNQLAIALWGTALRQLGDGREEEFNDTENLVQVFDLEAPEGFTDMETFNTALELFLDQLHPDRREPINQTSRHGTKTLGALFDAGHQPIDLLKTRIDGAVQTYIARMQEHDDHPLFRRRSKSFSYSGSWSTRLRDGGYHTNHVHPTGWISSAYYVALPDEMADESRQEGWLKFGEPSFDANLQHPIRRTVRPVIGRVVLFPSYMWHGTVAFRSQQTRTTIAFDVIPSSQ